MVDAYVECVYIICWSKKDQDTTANLLGFFPILYFYIVNRIVGLPQ